MAETQRRGLWATLRARFDSAALRVALPDRPRPPLRLPSVAQSAQWAPLHAWCFEGAGTGRSPLLRPTQAPAVEERFSVAAWPVANAAALDEIEAFSRHLDGSHQLLAAGGALAGLMLRLRVKACDVAWWRQRQAADPWDCGYALNEPAARAALARLEPRRATLVVAVNWPEEALLETVRALHQAAPRFAHPVRWLIVQSSPGPAAERLNSLGVPVTVFQLRAAAA